MASEISALEKHDCPACGAQAEWHPGKQKLMCPFCGTESPYLVDRETGQVAELDLVTALRELPDDERGWQTERRSVQCQSCRAVMVYDPTRVGQNCEFCGSPAMVPYDEIKSPIRPRGVLPFRIDTETVRTTIRRWWKRLWFAPNALSRAALVDQIRSLYIPYWTFDAKVHCRWEAESGTYYYVPVTHRSGGKTSVRMERRTRWRPAAGELDHVFDDEAIPGTKGLSLSLLRQVEPFPTREVVPYDTAFLSGHVVEHYQVVLLDAAKAAADQMHDRLLVLCAGEVPGDTHRNLRIAPEYRDKTFKHVLVPVWLLSYVVGAKTFNVIVNGYTGALAGERPYSVWKIALLVLAALAVIATLVVLR